MNRRRANLKQEVVQAASKPNNAILVAVNNSLAIANPIIKRTKSGVKFVVHSEVKRQSSSPHCFCHEKTFLAPADRYFTCLDCHETHHIHCHESRMEDLFDLFNLDELCFNCDFKRRQQQ